MTLRTWAYIAGAFTVLVLSVYFFLSSITYMADGMVATSLLSALIGFTLLAASVQLFRISALSRASEGSSK